MCQGTLNGNLRRQGHFPRRAFGDEVKATRGEKIKETDQRREKKNNLSGRTTLFSLLSVRLMDKSRRDPGQSQQKFHLLSVHLD